MLRKVLVWIGMLLGMLVFLAQAVTISKHDAELAELHQQYITQFNANAEQHKLNQALIDMVNTHEYYLPMHHCTIQGLMFSHGALDRSNSLMMPCIPQFLKREGYSSPKDEYEEPHLIPYIQPVVGRDPRRNG